MTLNLLLAPQPPDVNTLILADPFAPTDAPGASPSASRGSLDPVVAGLVSQLNVHRVMFPLPHETARRYVTPPSLIRSRHADLWHALSADERSRVLLVAGPTAAYLTPVLEGDASTIVAVLDPREAKAPVQGAWRSVLGPFPELDEVPAESGSAKERDRWRDRIRAATSRLELVRATELAAITAEAAAAIGLTPKQATRAGAVAVSAGAEPYGRRRPKRAAHWLDEVLYVLSRPPKPGRDRDITPAPPLGHDRSRHQRLYKHRRR